MTTPDAPQPGRHWLERKSRVDYQAPEVVELLGKTVQELIDDIKHGSGKYLVLFVEIAEEEQW